MFYFGAVVMYRFILSVAVVGQVMLASAQHSEAGEIALKRQTVAMPTGTKASLQDIFAWDERCRPVEIGFKPVQVENGKLYAVPETYSIKGKSGDPCNGKRITGKEVFFQPSTNFRGKATISYMVTTKGVQDRYVISRTIIVR